MSKLFYTTALSLITSSAMAMVQTAEDVVANGPGHLTVTEQKCTPTDSDVPHTTFVSHITFEEIRADIDSEYLKTVEALSLCEPNKKSTIINSFMSALAFYGSNENAISDAQKTELYLNYLSIMRNEYGTLPGTAHIILGDLYFIADAEQKDKINTLLDGEPIQFSAQDIFDLHSAFKDADLFALVSAKNIVSHRDKTQFAPFYAMLFKPFMQSSFFSYLPTEKTTFNCIRELFDAELKHVNPMMRHRLTQRLNVLAMFESGLASKSTDEALAELYVRMENGKMSVALATFATLEKWDIDAVREEKVTMCIEALDTEAVKSYEWVEDDLKDFIAYRLGHPDAEMPSTYSEDLIADYCKKIRNNECTIEQATRAITIAWVKDGILDNAIADCAERLNEAKGNERDQAEYLETVTSLFDFALLNQNGRSGTYEWSDESNEEHIEKALEILRAIKDKSGQLPGIAQILLGDILPITNYEQKDEIIALLDYKHPSFSVDDVATLLSGINNDSPLDAISLDNIATYCIVNDPIVLCGALLKTFMKYRIIEHSEDEENDLKDIMQFIAKNYKSLDPEERQEISQKLNLMAIFESGLAAEYGTQSNYGELVQKLSDKIEHGELSTQDAADDLYQQFIDDEALEYEIQTCAGLLDEEGFQSYTWEDDENESETSLVDDETVASSQDNSAHTASSRGFRDNDSHDSQSGDGYGADADELTSSLSAE
jgi:hypothetical protein